MSSSYSSLFGFHHKTTMRPHTLQSSCLESKGGVVDVWPDALTC